MSDEVKRDALPPRLDVIEVLAEQIPNSLWSVWRLIPRENGKPGKIPCRISESGKPQNIGHDSPAQWVNFTSARAWYEVGNVQGLGLLIGANPKEKPKERYSSGLVALDIDGCLDETGELAASVGVEVRGALDELQAAGAYIEISPSGTGLRALWFGARPEGVGERWSISGVSGELYDGYSSRFVTVCGHVWKGSPIQIVEPGEGFTRIIYRLLKMLADNEGGSGLGLGFASARSLPPISDTDLITKLKQSGQGKGKRLWDGNKRDYGDDWSSADAALCRLIARWTDDEAQVGRVWAASALADRDKFRSRRDYRERTIIAALASARSDASQGSKSKTIETKAAIVSKAIEAGDSSGVLASIIAATWGGKVPSTVGAADAIITYDRRLAGAVTFDKFSMRTLKLRSLRECLGDIAPPDDVPRGLQEWSDADDRVLMVWLDRVWGIRLHSKDVGQAVDIAARRVSVNTVVGGLDALLWDGVPRLDSLLMDYFNADEMEDSPRYLSAIGRKWMIGTVARAYEPGCKHDAVLVMQGGQGVGKSSAIRELVEAVAPGAFMEGLPPLDRGVEAERAIMGVWVCELSELACLSRAETEAVKGFLSKRYDDIRHPHEKRMTKVPRTVSFCGTTNQREFIRDSEGRRFWTFKVRHKIDVDRLSRDAPQLWAEAVTAYKAGEAWHLMDDDVVRMASASQGRRLERDGWDELIEVLIIEPMLEGKFGPVEQFDMQALELWELVRPGEAVEFSRTCKAFSQALIRAGLAKRLSGGKSMWRPSDETLAQSRGGVS